MNHTLKEPEEYLHALRRIREHNRYAENWKLYLKKKKNRHPTSEGYNWGWYEIFPLEIEVGYWESGSGRDDLKDVDVKAWNEKAEKLSV